MREQWAKSVRGAEMDQNANNGGAKWVNGAEMDQNAKFVLNNGGSEGPKWIKTPNSC